MSSVGRKRVKDERESINRFREIQRGMKGVLWLEGSEEGEESVIKIEDNFKLEEAAGS